MKESLRILAISMALFFAPIEAAREGALKKVHAHKTAMEKSTAQKRAGRHAKPLKSTKKEVEKKYAAKERDELVGKTTDGKPVFEGSKKGHYYMGEKGNKEYIKNFVGAKIVGYTHDGREIYEGSHGGHFYYTASGNKEYVRK